MDAPRSGRPKTVDDAEIVARTLEPPPKRLGVTHWSSRLLASELGLGDATVARCWRWFGLQPWRRETFKFSTDPNLGVKVRDVIGLYLDPPEKAVVLCVDEKSRENARLADHVVRTGDPTGWTSLRRTAVGAARSAVSGGLGSSGTRVRVNRSLRP